MPYAFTEQGIAMLSSVLRSKQAVQVNIAIMRAFVRLRQVLAAHKELAHKLERLERKVGALDSDVKAIFDAIKQLMSPPPDKPKKIGFLKG
jgi:pyruvate/2-oxoglutarate dehydrogenase complex dihydrolipoamide acyltransferase (E2) component